MSLASVPVVLPSLPPPPLALADCALRCLRCRSESSLCSLIRIDRRAGAISSWSGGDLDRPWWWRPPALLPPPRRSTSDSDSDDRPDDDEEPAKPPPPPPMAGRPTATAIISSSIDAASL